MSSAHALNRIIQGADTVDDERHDLPARISGSTTGGAASQSSTQVAIDGRKATGGPGTLSPRTLAPGRWHPRHDDVCHVAERTCSGEIELLLLLLTKMDLFPRIAEDIFNAKLQGGAET